MTLPESQCMAACPYCEDISRGQKRSILAIRHSQDPPPDRDAHLKHGQVRMLPENFPDILAKRLFKLLSRGPEHGAYGPIVSHGVAAAAANANAAKSSQVRDTQSRTTQTTAAPTGVQTCAVTGRLQRKLADSSRDLHPPQFAPVMVQAAHAGNAGGSAGRIRRERRLRGWLDVKRSDVISGASLGRQQSCGIGFAGGRA